jgi:Flp pilus assembly protein TadD
LFVRTCSFPLLVLFASLLNATALGAQRPPPAAPAQASPAAIERQLLAAVERNPKSFDAHHALGEFYLQRGDLAAAVPHLEHARDLDPSHYANGYNLALACVELGRFDAARREIARLLQMKNTGELHNLLADIEQHAGNHVGAAEEYQRAAHLHATEDHLFDWGDHLLQMRAVEPATDVFAAGVARYPKSARLHIGLGIAQYSRGQYEAAVTSFCRAADLAPSDPRPYQFLGEMYGVWPDKSGEVTKRLARFVAARPNDALGQYYYAMNLWKGPASATPADLARVETRLRRAVALDPKLAKASLQLGILLSEQRRWREAIAPLKQAIALEPDDAQAHFRLAQAYQRTNQPELANDELAMFEKLKARDPASNPR